MLLMNELYKAPEPLFTLDEIKDTLKKIDLSERGSDEEYGEAVFAEFVQLAKTRERLKNIGID